jgi:hypothetical protein
MNDHLQRSNDSRSRETWTLFRVDDRGNQFTVRTGLTREEAELLAHEFESRGHKQFYWAEQTSDFVKTGPM